MGSMETMLHWQFGGNFWCNSLENDTPQFNRSFLCHVRHLLGFYSKTDSVVIVAKSIAKVYIRRNKPIAQQCEMVWDDMTETYQKLCDQVIKYCKQTPSESPCDNNLYSECCNRQYLWEPTWFPFRIDTHTKNVESKCKIVNNWVHFACGH